MSSKHNHIHNNEHECHNHSHGEACSCRHGHHEHEKHLYSHVDGCSCGHEHHEHEKHTHSHEDGCSFGHEQHEHEDHTHPHEDGCSCGHKHHEYEKHQHSHDASAHIFILENLGCANCAAKMEAKINALPEVTSAVITFATKQLCITAEHPQELLPQLQAICSSIESQVKVVPKSNPSSNIEETASKNKKNRMHDHSGNHREVIEIGIGAILFLLGLLLHHNAFQPQILLAFFLIGYLILGRHILLEAGRKMIHGHVLDENFLMSIATIGAFAIGEYPEALGIMLFYRIGELFEHTAVERSRKQIMDAVDLRPDVVRKLADGVVQVIPAADTQIGDILLIRPGDRIPLDGVVVDGSSRIDTSPITGEPVPVNTAAGDELLSGCVNLSGQLKVRVQKVLSESMVSKILDSVEHAAASKPKIDRFITRFAKIYTPFVVGTALLTAIVPSLITGDWSYWIYTALTFLVISCPCALVLSVPLAFFSGIGAGSKQGILFKGGMSIEALSGIKAVVMDKTGTITHGNFKLQEVVSLNNANKKTFSKDELLRICASCEHHSSHPIATSIVNAAKEKHLPLSEPLHMEEIAGHGIVAAFEDKQVLCGNKKLMDKFHIALDAISNDETYAALYGSEVFLAIDGVLSGYFIISDTLKSDAKDAIKRLKSQNLHTAMLTGDSKDSASFVASSVGVDDVYAKLLPQDKLEILSKIRQSHGAVLFIGDGINDAPVLAGADVGAAMGSGADAAIEAADAVFMNSSMNAVPEAIAIAKQTNTIAKQNVGFALFVKLLVMILGLFGFANMWMAVFADTGVAMLCVVNSIRVLYKKRTV